MGVIALEDIEAGQLIAEYVGESSLCSACPGHVHHDESPPPSST